MGRGISIARKTFVSACLSASMSLKPRKGGRGGKCPQGGTEAGLDTEAGAEPRPCAVGKGTEFGGTAWFQGYLLT